MSKSPNVSVGFPNVQLLFFAIKNAAEKINFQRHSVYLFGFKIDGFLSYKTSIAFQLI